MQTADIAPRQVAKEDLTSSNYTHLWTVFGGMQAAIRVIASWPTPDDRTGAVSGVDDLATARQLREALTQLYTKEAVTLELADPGTPLAVEELRGAHLVVVGGPANNTVARWLQKELLHAGNLKYRFEPPEAESDWRLVHVEDGRILHPQPPPRGHDVPREFEGNLVLGLTLKGTTPWGKQVLWVAGVTRVATNAAARFLQCPLALKYIAETYGSDGFALVHTSAGDLKNRLLHSSWVCEDPPPPRHWRGRLLVTHRYDAHSLMLREAWRKVYVGDFICHQFPSGRFFVPDKLRVNAMSHNGRPIFTAAVDLRAGHVTGYQIIAPWLLRHWKDFGDHGRELLDLGLIGKEFEQAKRVFKHKERRHQLVAVCGLDCVTEDLVEQVIALAPVIAPDQLVLELVDPERLEGSKKALLVLKELRQLGVSIWFAAKDFATALAALCRRPDALRLKWGEKWTMPRDQAARTRLCIVEAARGEGILVAEEGIDTPEDFVEAAQAGVRFGFGALFGVAGTPSPSHERSVAGRCPRCGSVAQGK